jgi:glutathione synthase/RimK-type ligase-like ATP-grasp enzyme
MTKPSVAVVKSDFYGHHSTSWNDAWLEYCADQDIPHELIDWRALDAFDDLAKHDVVLWHYSHYSADEMRFARNILVALKASGCTVFPDVYDADHFDDKVAQAYLLKGLGFDAPKNYPLHGHGAVETWLREVGTFPVVAKLRAGSGSSNVMLLKNAVQLRRYARRMFGRGLNSKPGTIFKVRSNLATARSLNDIFKRLKRAPEFLFSLRNAMRRERERGYVYLQEFIPGVDYDLKVVVIGDQLSFIGRAVRKDDFRASGGGGLFYDRALVTPALIETAFQAADVLQSDCTGFDMIIDPRNGRPVILEICYGFSHTALLQAGGHFDREGIWHNVPLNAPCAVAHRMLEKARLQ